jgi:hypothetical protein
MNTITQLCPSVNPDTNDDTQPYTAADEAWASQAFGETTEGGECESDYDELAAAESAAESAALDALELGLLPRDLADFLMSTSLVGHQP